MAHAALAPWTLSDFFAWQARQPDRYELVGGLPVRMMAGANNRHDKIVLNILGEFRSRLRGSRCEGFTADSAVETCPGQIRRFDAGIDCGERPPDGYVAIVPSVVVEVLSPSTRDFDTFEKLAEYKGVETIEHILYVEPNRAEAMVWSRGPDRNWVIARSEGPEAVVELPAVGISLPLAEIYDGIELPPFVPVRTL